MKTLHRPMLLITLFSCSTALMCMEQKSSTMPLKTYVKPYDINTLSNELYQEIKDSFNPDLIIAVGRGGWAPTVYLAGERMFNQRHIASISVESYNDNMEQGNIKLLMPFHTEDYLNYKNILVVDDLVDTGNTFNYILNFLTPALKEATIKTAVLFCKLNKTIYVPHYYAQDADKWIVFPQENQ